LSPGIRRIVPRFPLDAHGHPWQYVVMEVNKPYIITKLDGTWYYVLDVVAAHLAGAALVSGEYPTRRTAEDAARLALGLDA
jgi:hypothetical protein